MKKISKDDNAWIYLITNPIILGAIAVVIIAIIIWLTAATPGLALIGFILLIAPFGSVGPIKIYFPKGIYIISPVGFALLLIGYFGIFNL